MLAALAMYIMHALLVYQTDMPNNRALSSPYLARQPMAPYVFYLYQSRRLAGPDSSMLSHDPSTTDWWNQCYTPVE